MPKKLVVVESPTKAKTLERYLGSEYSVTASKGHVRDLPEKDMVIRAGLDGVQPLLRDLGTDLSVVVERVSAFLR